MCKPRTLQDPLQLPPYCMCLGLVRWHQFQNTLFSVRCVGIKPSLYLRGLVLPLAGAHGIHMYRVSLLILVVAGYAARSTAQDAFGTWKVKPMHVTDSYAKSTEIRFEPHIKGEIFTLDRTDEIGRSTTSSSILYLDSKTRDFQGFGCLGTQSSRRLDSNTVEILRTCASGEWTRFVRRLSLQPREMILEILEHQADGRRLERHLLLEKQP